jgi:hypothetical protein
LVVSFFRTPESRFVKGVPIWSFYNGYKDDFIFENCLYDDMHYDFANHHKLEMYDKKSYR